MITNFYSEFPREGCASPQGRPHEGQTGGEGQRENVSKSITVVSMEGTGKAESEA